MGRLTQKLREGGKDRENAEVKKKDGEKTERGIATCKKRN